MERRESVHTERAQDQDQAAVQDPSFDSIRRWDPDVAGVLARGLIDGRSILYLFTGSDWSPMGGKWLEGALGQEEFYAVAEQRYHLALVDFPKGTQASARVQDLRVNLALSEKFRVRSLPSLVLVDPEGPVLAALRWSPDKPAELLAELERRANATRELSSHLNSWSKELAGCGNAGCRLNAYRNATEFLTTNPEPSVSADPAYRFLEGVFDLGDPQALPLHRRVLKCLHQAERANLKTLRFAMSADPNNEHGVFEQFLDGSFGEVVAKPDAGEYLRLLQLFRAQAKSYRNRDALASIATDVAYWCWSPAQLDDRESAVELADWAVELNPKSFDASRANRLLQLNAEASRTAQQSKSGQARGAERGKSHRPGTGLPPNSSG